MRERTEWGSLFFLLLLLLLLHQQSVIYIWKMMKSFNWRLDRFKSKAWLCKYGTRNICLQTKYNRTTAGEAENVEYARRKRRNMRERKRKWLMLKGDFLPLTSVLCSLCVIVRTQHFQHFQHFCIVYKSLEYLHKLCNHCCCRPRRWQCDTDIHNCFFLSTNICKCICRTLLVSPSSKHISRKWRRWRIPTVRTANIHSTFYGLVY